MFLDSSGIYGYQVFVWHLLILCASPLVGSSFDQEMVGVCDCSWFDSALIKYWSVHWGPAVVMQVTAEEPFKPSCSLWKLYLQMTPATPLFVSPVDYWSSISLIAEKHTVPYMMAESLKESQVKVSWTTIRVLWRCCYQTQYSCLNSTHGMVRRETLYWWFESLLYFYAPSMTEWLTLFMRELLLPLQNGYRIWPDWWPDGAKRAITCKATIEAYCSLTRVRYKPMANNRVNDLHGGE
jgi:hypothetical protein